MRIIYADLGAGLASAELGPISLVIAYCTSMSVAYSIKVPPIVISNPPTFPENPYNAFGVDHNKAVIEYYKLGLNRIDFSQIKEAAKNVRPDLVTQIDNLDNSELQAGIDIVKTFDPTKPNSILQFMKNYINTDEATDQLILNHLNSIILSETPIDAIKEFELAVKGYNISSTDKVKLLKSLAVLRNSSYLWVAE